MTTRNVQEVRARRITRTRAKIDGTAERPRLTVRRTLTHVYVQVIDDGVGKTIAACSDLDLKKTAVKGKTKTEIAFLVGKAVAERAKAKGVERVVFDRRDKKYHGRVKAVADGARDEGLQF
ncbi:50S ribosomal protein L18 [Patescibacteria group bacterium]|nr:50S ribosomal protein L18 [Patescibacteria group bacterium]MBU1448288.1 50S ribosomal protein L18 [Patescibacteria group bacterium]MBU2613102.1 50S ribosomal protein L18 [Patescibacteria group bacterium]